MKKAKSLLRVSESVEQIRWRLQYGAASQDKSLIDNQIVVSNDKSLERTKAESSTFGHNFGLMEKSRDYYIYAFMNERKVFTSTFSVVWTVLLAYVLLLIIVNMLMQRAEKLYQKNQLAM